jgi:hypothetical protein
MKIDERELQRLKVLTQQLLQQLRSALVTLNELVAKRDMTMNDEPKEKVQ